MYYRSPKTWRTWNHATFGFLGPNTYNVLKNEFGVRYGVCTRHYQALYKLIERDPRIDIVHETEKVFVFKLQEA
jgi:hypothetical protein